MAKDCTWSISLVMKENKQFCSPREGERELQREGGGREEAPWS